MTIRHQLDDDRFLLNGISVNIEEKKQLDMYSFSFCLTMAFLLFEKQ